MQTLQRLLTRNVSRHALAFFASSIQALEARGSFGELVVGAITCIKNSLSLSFSAASLVWRADTIGYPLACFSLSQVFNAGREWSARNGT